MKGDITDQIVHVRVRAAWGIVATIIATTVWLTSLLITTKHTNDTEHAKLLLGITELNQKASNFATRDEVEEALMFAAVELHYSMSITNGAWEAIRTGIRQRLHSPKATP